MQSAAVSDLKRALDAYSKVDRFHQSEGFKRVTPAKLKQLALAVEPRAAVRRTPVGNYECRIAGAPIRNNDSTHATPLKAWACIARHLVRVTVAPSVLAVHQSVTESETDGNSVTTVSVTVTVTRQSDHQHCEHAA